MINHNSDKPGYKHTPIGWIPEDWELTELGEALILKRGYDLTKRDRKEGSIPVFTSGGSNGYHNVSMVKGPGVITGRYGTIGEVFFSENDFFPHNTTLYVQEFKKVSPLYAYHLLRSINFKAYSDKSAVPGINRNHIHNEVIVIPPSNKEQANISTVLSTWDMAIDKIQQVINYLQQRNKGLMHRLLTGSTRVKKFTGEWKELCFGEVFIERNETGNANQDLLSVGLLGVYPQSQSEKRDISNVDKTKYKRICPGDIGYNTMRMWQGRSALSSIEGIVSPAYTVITPKEQQYSLFYSFLFKLPSIINKFFRHSQGLVEDTLNCKFKDFAIIKVRVPDYREQVVIAQIISEASNEVQLLEQELYVLQRQKKALMQKLLTGETRIKIK